MLCQPCSAIFAREAFPGFKPPAAHHGTAGSLLQAAEDGCYVCSFFWRVLSEDGRKIVLNEPRSRAASVTTFEISKHHISGKDETPLQLAIKFDPAFFEFPNFVVAFGIVPVPEDHVASGEKTETRVYESHIALARKWSTQCVKEHDFCRRYRDMKWRLPSRVLDVGDDSCADVRLLETNSQGLSGPYLTLSHCWGLSGMLKLTLGTFGAFVSGFPVSKLPKTFQDMVTTTRSLGFRYVWIDALCIIQDSPEDWERESIHMGEIYGGAILSIAASASPNSAEGFLPRSAPSPAVYVRPSWTDFPSSGGGALTYRIECNLAIHHEIASSVLNSRGWVHQEMQLPPAILHFASGQVWFGCAEATCNEEHPGGLPSYMGELQFSNLKQLLLQSRSAPASPEDAATRRRVAMTTWFEIATAYNATDLTRPSDKLVAIAGLANLLRLVFGPDVVYNSGVWSCFLAEQLLWCTAELGAKRHQGRPLIPTWSWASVDGRTIMAVPGETFGEDRALQFGALPNRRFRAVAVAEMWRAKDGGGEEGGGLDVFGRAAAGEQSAIRITGTIREFVFLEAVNKIVFVSAPIRLEESGDMLKITVTFDCEEEWRGIDWTSERRALVVLARYDEWNFGQGLILKQLEGRDGWFTRCGTFNAREGWGSIILQDAVERTVMLT